MDIKFKRLKSKKLSRKAVLFSLISVLFSVLFITIFSQNFNTLYEDRIPGSNIRIKVMDTYVRNFETYIDDSVKVSAYRTLDAVTRYGYSQNKFFADFYSFNKTFHDCMICNRVDCSNAGSSSCNLGSYYLDARLWNITNLSNKELNIKTTYHINSVSIEQRLAFEVEVKINISYNITDNSDENYYARWSKETVLIQPISIIGLLEPMGNINDSTDRYNRTIKRYQGICEYDDSGSCWNNDTTQQFYQDVSFRLQKNSSSFLQRYWSDNSPSSCCGIETILHPSELPIPPNGNNSYVEHYYWNYTYGCSGGKTISVYLLNGDKISLDSNTASRYGLTDSDIVGIVCRS
jgi:hypothetical protein